MCSTAPRPLPSNAAACISESGSLLFCIRVRSADTGQVLAQVQTGHPIDCRAETLTETGTALGGGTQIPKHIVYLLGQVLQAMGPLL